MPLGLLQLLLLFQLVLFIAALVKLMRISLPVFNKIAWAVISLVVPFAAIAVLVRKG